MWAEIAEKRDKFIGGLLQDTDFYCGVAPSSTKITGVDFDGEMFTVSGEEYDCSINREYAGLGARDGWFVVSGPAGCGFMFRVKGPDDAGS